MLKKIKVFISKMCFFLKARHFLANGVYYIFDGSFYLITKASKPKDHKITRRVLIFSIFKNNRVSQGKYLCKDYKFIMISQDKTYYFYKNKSKFICLRDKYYKYKDLIKYKTPQLNFQKNKTIITETIVGKKPTGLSKIVLDYLFLCASENLKSNESAEAYVQHGDMKNSNILSNEGGLTIIDLDDIDIYPVLFDILFYILINCKKQSGAYFKSKDFIDKLTTLFLNSNSKKQYTVDELLCLFFKKCKELYSRDNNAVDFEYRIRWLRYLDANSFKNIFCLLNNDTDVKKLTFKDV